MKIKVESDKIMKVLKKLEGIELVLENPNDAREALHVILGKTEVLAREDYAKLKDILVTSYQRYETSAVDYKVIFLLEFIFEEDTPADKKVAMIKDLQEFFNKV